MNGQNEVDESILTIIYQSLLERDPDETGVAAWCHGATVDQVLESVKQSDEYCEKIQARAALASLGRVADGAVARDAGAAIERSGGLGAAASASGACSPIQLFSTFPWNATRLPGDLARTFRILGPYADRLGRECSRRFRRVKVAVGMPKGRPDKQDVLVLTDPLYLAGLSAYWPEMIVNTRHRLLTPSLVNLGGPHNLSTVHTESVRRILHAHSFMEVSTIFRRRPDVEVVTETTQLTHAPGEYRRIPHAILRRVERPQFWWLAANRIPVEDR